MSFIEMTGSTLERIVADDELHHDDLSAAGVDNGTIVRCHLPRRIQGGEPAAGEEQKTA